MDLFIIGLNWFCNEKLDISIAYQKPGYLVKKQKFLGAPTKVKKMFMSAITQPSPLKHKDPKLFFEKIYKKLQKTCICLLKSQRFASSVPFHVTTWLTSFLRVYLNLTRFCFSIPYANFFEYVTPNTQKSSNSFTCTNAYQISSNKYT